MASAPPPPFPSHISHHSSTALLLSPSPSPSPASSRSIPLLGPIVLLFIVFLFFLSFFLFRDFLHIGHALIRGGIQAARRPPRPPTHGLDPAILATFPTLPYSLVKGLQEGKCGAECAVCLGEFASGDIIRLLTVCCHAFHPPCIDSWLAAHATCPVCRSDLQAPPDEAAVMAVREAVGGESDAGESHAIDIDAKGEVEARSERLGPARGEEARVTGMEHDRV